MVCSDETARSADDSTIRRRHLAGFPDRRLRRYLPSRKIGRREFSKRRRRDTAVPRGRGLLIRVGVGDISLLSCLLKKIASLSSSRLYRQHMYRIARAASAGFASSDACSYCSRCLQSAGKRGGGGFYRPSLCSTNSLEPALVGLPVSSNRGHPGLPAGAWFVRLEPSVVPLLHHLFSLQLDGKG